VVRSGQKFDLVRLLRIERAQCQAVAAAFSFPLRLWRGAMWRLFDGSI